MQPSHCYVRPGNGFSLLPLSLSYQTHRFCPSRIGTKILDALKRVVQFEELLVTNVLMWFIQSDSWV